MSNRNRIARLQAEAEIGEREKEEKRKERAATGGSTTRKKKTTSAVEAAPERLKMVWAVHSPNGKIVSTYPYPDREAANAEAARLTRAKDVEHYVRPAKVAMD